MTTCANQICRYCLGIAELTTLLAENSVERQKWPMISTIMRPETKSQYFFTSSVIVAVRSSLFEAEASSLRVWFALFIFACRQKFGLFRKKHANAGVEIHLIAV